jgi:hypothetical protein
LIGWSSWDREEWEHNKDYLQVTAGGTDSVPESMEEEYKEWVLKQTMQELDRKQLEWHTKIYELHTTLQDAGIAHLFFNTYSWFRSHVQDPLDWHNCYLDPYNEEGTYNSWCLQNKYKPVRYGSYHYGRDAHIGWYKHLLPRLTNTNSDVTIKTVRSVTQPKVIK